MGLYGQKYHYLIRSEGVSIWEEYSPGNSRRIANITNCHDRIDVAKNMVSALNARHKYKDRMKNLKESANNINPSE